FELYRDAPAFRRLMSALRPYICPFEPIVRLCPQDQHILDIGCGSGALLNLLAWTGRIRNGTGCGLSADGIDAGKRGAARQSQAKRDFSRTGDFVEAPAGPFEVVVTVDVLHPIPPSRQRQFIEALATRVAPGGRLIFKDMASRPTWRRWGNWMHDLILSRQMVNHVPMELVESWARDAGLELI